MACTFRERRVTDIRMLKRGLVAALIVGVVSFSGFGIEGPAITQVFYRPTAYTLPAGVWELEGKFSLFAFGLPTANMAYGLTESLQISTGLSADLFGMPNLGIKLALSRTGPVRLAASAGVTYLLADGSLYLRSGLSASLQAGVLGIHMGASLRMLPELSFSPYAAFDYALAGNVALLGEVSVLPFQARVGALFRPLRSFDLKLWTGFPVFSVGASGALRF